MPLTIRDPELFGVTETSLTLSFRIEDGNGPVAATARIRVGEDLYGPFEGHAGTRMVRIEGLEPATRYRLSIEAPGAPAPEPDPYLPGHVETLPAPGANEVGSLATLNDLHFGEPRFGGVLLEDGDYGEEAPGCPAIHARDTEIPYWQFMNEDAIQEINALGPDLAIIKGDIADRGRTDQFRAAARAFEAFQMPHHAFLGNHDHYALHEGQVVDGCALLDQPPAPRTVRLGAWRLVLLDTVLPGEHHGVLPEDRLRWLRETLAETREAEQPTLLFMHHQPVPPERRKQFPNTIGLVPEHSLRLFDLIAGSPQVRGVLIGHTHRNRVRHYGATGSVPFVEVNCTKDYPGGFAHYRLFEDGSFRQEVRRTSTERALSHSTRCRDFFNGMYRHFALGPLEARCFVAGQTPGPPRSRAG